MAKLNFVEISIDKEDIKILKNTYDKNIWDTFKEDYYNLIRVWDDMYYLWDNATDERVQWFLETTININDYPQIFRKIIENWLIDFFKSNKLFIKHDKYSNIWSIKLNKKEMGLWELLIFECLNFSLITQKAPNWKIIFLLTINRSYKTEFWDLWNNIDTTIWDRNQFGKLIASKKNIYLYLDNIGKRYIYDKRQNELRKGEWFSSFFQKILKRLQTVSSNLNFYWGIKVTINNNLNIPNSIFRLEKLSAPKYYMYNNRSNDDLPISERQSYYNNQLKVLFPYSYWEFQNKTIDLCILSPNEYKLTVENFCVKLKESLKEIFHLNVNIYEQYFDIRWVEINQIWNKYIEEIDNIKDIEKYSVVINVFKNEDKKILIENSPYYLSKAKLLNKQIMSQEVTIETIKSLNNPFILNNISLNIYWKLGWCAWTIEKEWRTTKEFVIWIWSTMVENKRIVWMANVFDYNWMYKVWDCYETSWIDGYWKLLEKSLVGIINNYIKDLYDEWNKIRVIFHLFKDSSKTIEIDIIEKVFKNTLWDNWRDNVEYCFIHLSYNHNFKSIEHLKWDLVYLTDYSSLLFVNTRNVPILVKIDKRSSFSEDLYWLSKQIFYFCHLSHRNFTPSSKPVSMLYAWLMASLSSWLNKIKNWDPTILWKINKKLWFI